MRASSPKRLPAFHVVLVSVCVLVAACLAQASPGVRLADPGGADRGSPRPVPPTVWFQGFLADATTGEPVEASYDITAQIFGAESGGVSIWGPEVHPQVPVRGGWFMIELGSIVEPLPEFVEPPYFLEITVAGEVLEPRSRLASVPTAIFSSESLHPDGDWIIDGESVYREIGHVGIGTATPEAELDVAGTVRTAGFEMPTSPAAGHVLMSDASGVGTWQPAPGTVGGGGTADYVPKFTAPTIVQNSVIYENGGHVGIGTTDTEPARVNIENAGAKPALRVRNTSTWGEFGLLELERTEPMTTGGFDTFIEMKANRNSTDGHFLSCILADSLLWDRNFRVDLDGYVWSAGGMAVAATGKSEAILAMNNLEADTARVIDALYTGTGGYNATAVYGTSTPVDGNGIGGRFVGGFIGSQCQSWPTGGHVYYGVDARCDGGSGYNYGVHSVAVGNNTNYAFYGYAGGGVESWAGYFSGDVRVTGNLVNPSAAMEIDHPLDPADRCLRHAYVASPEMKTVYDGTVALDADGAAWVELPDWFEALNGDVRYQLTPVGAPAPNLHVAEPIAENRFRIAGGQPGMTVSWMVTGVRHDPAASVLPLEVESDKRRENRGRYLVPEAYGASREERIGYHEPTTEARPGRRRAPLVSP